MEGQNQPITYSVGREDRELGYPRGGRKGPEVSPPGIKKGTGADDLRGMVTVGWMVGRGERV